MYIHYGEIVLQAVITEVIAKRTFWFLFSFTNGAGNDEISVTGKEVVVFKQVAEAAPSQQASKSKLTQTLWQGHNSREGMRWSTTHKNGATERFVALVVHGMVHSNTSVQLVVQANFLVEFVFVSTQLDAVHANIALHSLFATRWECEYLR